MGSPGCRICAHRWRVSENRSQPCLNSCHRSHLKRRTRVNVDTHDKQTHHAGTDVQNGGCSRAYLTEKTPWMWPTWPLFPVRTSHAKSLIGVGVSTPRQCVAFSSTKTKHGADRSRKNITKSPERRSVPRPLSGLLLSMENSSVTAGCLNKG